jgi:hypothetical protein
VRNAQLSQFGLPEREPVFKSAGTKVRAQPNGASRTVKTAEGIGGYRLPLISLIGTEL